MKHCLVFASLISPSKMILFEKKYQTFDTVFHHQMKHLEVRQKYSAASRIFNSRLGVSSGDETLHLMFDILRQVKHYTLLDQNVTTAYSLYRLYVTIKFVVVRRLRQSLACIKVIFFGYHVVCCDTHGTVTLTKMAQMPFYNTIRVNQTTEQQVFPIFFLTAVNKLDIN